MTIKLLFCQSRIPQCPVIVRRECHRHLPVPDTCQCIPGKYWPWGYPGSNPRILSAALPQAVA
ncbi:MAG: hypothetical protein LBN74_09125 [Prevotella sp.]|nr:hypothetical protein [Prevotella sp.]